jgi:hypothetical protein
MRNCWLDHANEKRIKRKKQIATARREMGERFDEKKFIEVLDMVEEAATELNERYGCDYPYSLWNIKSK